MLRGHDCANDAARRDLSAISQEETLIQNAPNALETGEPLREAFSVEVLAPQ
jgi:hypothetical protein